MYHRNKCTDTASLKTHLGYVSSIPRKVQRIVQSRQCSLCGESQYFFIQKKNTLSLFFSGNKQIQLTSYCPSQLASQKTLASGGKGLFYISCIFSQLVLLSYLYTQLLSLIRFGVASYSKYHKTVGEEIFFLVGSVRSIDLRPHDRKEEGKTFILLRRNLFLPGSIIYLYIGIILQQQLNRD